MSWQSSNPAAVLDAVKHSHLDKVYENTFALDKGERHRGVKVFRSSDQTILNNTPTAFTPDADWWDTDNFHDTSTNVSRLTCPSGLPGTYLLGFQDRWIANATGERSGWTEQLNPAQTEDMPAVRTGAIAGACMYGNGLPTEFAGNQYAQHFVLQTSGGSLDLDCAGTINDTSFYMVLEK